MLNEKPILLFKEKSVELKKYFPRYVLEPTPLNLGIFERIWIGAIVGFIKMIIWIFLNPRKTSVGGLDKEEVNAVYSREARTYNSKHHLTTRGQDLFWRRWAGWAIVSLCRNNSYSAKILDLCTGTGLTIKEIITVLEGWGIEAKITGLDYNANMLTIARSSVESASENISVCFARGDATKLTYKSNSFDFVSQIFGIGGIDKPDKDFEEALRVLKPGGHFIMADIHRPIPELPGEWPFLLKWLRSSALEMSVHERVTVPLALKRLWAWRDPTPTFYLLPLAVIEDSGGFWGFKTNFFEVTSERWWLGLPIMWTGKIIAKKVSVSKEIYEARKAVLESCKISD